LNRDDFSEAVKRTLAMRVVHRCSNPHCRSATSGPQSDASKAVNLGVAAHITAAAGGGPRYDAALSPDERASIENGIWLCQICAKRVDSDPSRYSAALLRAWKVVAEADADSAIGRPATESERLYPVDLEMTYRTTNRLTGARGHVDRHDYELIVTLTNRGNEVLTDWQVEIEFPRAMRAGAISYGAEVPLPPESDYMKLRTQFEGTKKLFPDESYQFRPPYTMNDDLFEIRDALFKKRFRARAYVGGKLVAETEDTAGNMQNF